MGPTNIALVKLFQADQALREAQGRLESASRSVRVQERRIAELTEKLKASQQRLREEQARGGQLELDVRTHDEKIERYRTQQQASKSHKEYQIFLTEINTEKVDKAKVEEEALKVMETVEKTQAELADLNQQLEGERKKHDETRQHLGDKLAQLQAEVDRLQPLRDAVAAALPPKARDAFDRMAERFEGEAMGAIGKPDRRREEYICTACHMSLVADIYNRLHSRDELVTCPTCRRLLYIPADLPPDLAINKKERKELKELRPKPAGPAATGRQTSAADISRSIGMEEEVDTDSVNPDAPDETPQ